MEWYLILLRFAITFILSFLFGYQRQRAHKPIGFGTFTFVSVGSCALAITAVTQSPENPLPLLGAIVTGIGFLGAGALIKTSDKIFGFTSAASIWLFAVFGLVVGAGEYIIAGFIYVTIISVMLFDAHLERYGIGSYQRKVTIIANKMVPERDVEFLFGRLKYKRVSVEVDRIQNKQVMVYQLEGMKGEINKIPQRLSEKDWFQGFKAE